MLSALIIAVLAVAFKKDLITVKIADEETPEKEGGVGRKRALNKECGLLFPRFLCLFAFFPSNGNIHNIQNNRGVRETWR